MVYKLYDLTEEEIKRMVKEAELNREADSKKREIVDARNSLDSLVFGVEKMLKEAGDKAPADVKSEIEGALTEAKAKLTVENLDEIKGATERLQNASHKLTSQMYQGAGGPEAQGAGPEAGPDTSAKDNKKKNDDDVVDADFKEV